MTTKLRTPFLRHSDDRIIIHAGLFLLCALLSAMGLGAIALWCFIPAAISLELLLRLAPAPDNSRRV